jgi:hypothetical protein
MSSSPSEYPIQLVSKSVSSGSSPCASAGTFTILCCFLACLFLPVLIFGHTPTPRAHIPDSVVWIVVLDVDVQNPQHFDLLVSGGRVLGCDPFRDGLEAFDMVV